jgi:hypothetical protein
MILLGIFYNLGASATEITRFQLKKMPGSVSVPISGPGSDLINCNFPELTDLRNIAKAYSLWLGKEFSVNENLNLKVRLISAEMVSKPEALKRFHKR